MSVFRGGMPTRSDRNKLVEAFKDRKRGDLITHEEVTKVIGASPKTPHYNATTKSWCNHMLKHYNLQIVRRGRGRGVGFAVLDSGELTEDAGERFKQAGGALQRGAVSLDVVNTAELRGEQLGKYNLTRKLIFETGEAVQKAADVVFPKLATKTSNLRLIENSAVK